MRRFSFWLSAITAASLGFGILSVLLTLLALKEPESGVTFETISDTNVLDLRRPLQDLSIDFRGQNIQQQNLNLRIVTINIVNSGEVDILPGHYDHEDDWGIRFADGEVIEARLVDTSSEYLRSRVVPQSVGSDTVVFPKVILEKDAFFAVEVLLLHLKHKSPSISPVGKIAGIEEISVLERPLVVEEDDFVTELFRGSIVVQIVRTIIYWFGSLLVTIAILLSLVGLSDLFGRVSSRRRRRRVLATRTIREMSHGDTRDVLISQFEGNGIRRLREIRSLVRDPAKIRWFVPGGRWIAGDGDEIDDWSAGERLLDVERRFLGIFPALAALSEAGILKKGEDDAATIDATFVEAVDSLVSELEN